MIMGDIKFQSYRIAVRLKSVFRSLSIPYTINKFERLGYHAMIPVPLINPLIDENNIPFNGPLLKNGKSTIDLNSNINSIGIQTNSIEELRGECDNFFASIKEMLSDDNKIWFYEFQENVKFKENVSVMSKINVNGNIIDKASEFSKKIGIDVNVSSIGLWNTPDPDSENFMEIKIQPDILDKKLAVYKIIYRNPDENIFLNAIQTLTDTDLLSKIL